MNYSQHSSFLWVLFTVRVAEKVIKATFFYVREFAIARMLDAVPRHPSKFDQVSVMPNSEEFRVGPVFTQTPCTLLCTVDY